MKYHVLVLVFLIYSFLNLNMFKKLHVCLCTIGKQENLYVREFVNFYLNKGVDKIT